MSPLKKVQLLPIKAQILSERKVELFGFDTFFSRAFLYFHQFPKYKYMNMVQRTNRTAYDFIN